MNDPSGTLYEVTFERLVYGGEALGRLPDGRAVFVPFVLPGERARVRLVEEKKRFARGEVAELLQASSERIRPRCRHFTTCGGCHYQHMSYEKQLEVKTALLIDQLERIGRIQSPLVSPAEACGPAWYYRNTVQFHPTEDGRLGYVQASGEGVLAIEECHLPVEGLNELWPRLELNALQNQEEKPFQGPEIERLQGEETDQVDEALERVHLREGGAGELLVTLEGQAAQAPDFAVDFDLSAVYLGPERSVLLAGDDHVVMEVAGRLFRVSAGSFFQVNTGGAEWLVRHLLEALPLGPESTLQESTVLDVYCGVGLFSAFLAERAGQVVGVEAAPYACYDFEANLDEFDNVTLYEGEAGEVLPLLDLQPDVVVLDPPRAGVEAAALEAVIRMQPRVIAYVSCDPATLGRDARRLAEGGYRLEQVTPVDLFPQTYHIESMSLWKREE